MHRGIWEDCKRFWQYGNQHGDTKHAWIISLLEPTVMSRPTYLLNKDELLRGCIRAFVWLK